MCSPLVIGQHGGFYGVGRFASDVEHEVEISDEWLSWGWHESTQSKVHPIAMFKKIGNYSLSKRNENRITLVSFLRPRFSYLADSQPIASQMLSYFSDQFAFVEHLPSVICDKLTIRLLPKDYGWDQIARCVIVSLVCV